MKTLSIGGVKEKIVERKDFPPARLSKILGKETVAVIGYGVQGRGQSHNMRDNGVKVIVGVRKNGPSWKLAKKDGLKPGKTLFDIPEAVRRGTVVQYLLSDAGQKDQWSVIRDNLQEGAALYFSHGFSVTYSDITGVVAPDNVDVILVAPKGSGTTVRRLFLEGRGINSSFAIDQDFTGRARERCIALGIAIGSGYLFETSLSAGVCAMGGKVLLGGPLPTPAIAHLTTSMRADVGVVISASHNPYQDNGIKLFASDGFKLPDEEEEALEALMDSDVLDSKRPTGTKVGRAERLLQQRGRGNRRWQEGARSWVGAPFYFRRARAYRDHCPGAGRNANVDTSS